MCAFEVEIFEDGSITSTPGFEAAGVACGLKPDGALDLALVHSLAPCASAAVFTTNVFKAAPVLYDREIVSQNPKGVRGVVINSGCANACTGPQGMRDAEESASAAADALGVASRDVAVMSTGVIGMPMPMDKILSGIAQAVAARDASVEAGHAAARAILTTDTRPKEIVVRVSDGTDEFVIAGMAKGAGMIHPNMATLLCLVTTDAVIHPQPAQRALRETVEDSFNLISVDGDMSTNDTVLLLANGLAEMEPITSEQSAGYDAFVRGLAFVMTELAKGIVRDGEGATRFIEITVTGARNRDEAKQAAMSVANSLLVKTAIYGQDANWGRIICAAGYSGVDFDPDRVNVWLGSLEVVRGGRPFDVNEGRASEILAQPEIPIRVDLGQGDAQITVWTCDLSHEYVDINAHYRT
ncbi:MAG: bifunctional ornithine acetyltransferase/N-acetylglutamate synthase [Chloroflexi bacterium RBG_13_56_8]|nr:MAG: bifunctional ornithine acetyltransferase/N-acetylglutamate synthase [Chloroflexi bacterium RBG_13_56_8]